MKDIEIITQHLNKIAKLAVDTFHGDDREGWNRHFWMLREACDLANELGYTTNYNPLTNTFTVSKED